MATDETTRNAASTSGRESLFPALDPTVVRAGPRPSEYEAIRAAVLAVYPDRLKDVPR